MLLYVMETKMTDYTNLIARLEERGGRIPTAAAQAIRNLEARLEATKDKAEEAILDLMSKLRAAEKYRDAYAECDRIGTEAVRDLEAKLAECEARLGKAVEALTDIVKDCEAEYPPSHGAIKYFCRTTLAEIEGEKG
jgi:chromosome segregation ATPase